MDFSKMQCELLEVEGALNVRDVGGYAIPDGGKVAKGKFIRAGSLYKLTDKGIAELRRIGIDCIVDLRSGHEVEMMPDILATDDKIDYFHASMLDYIQSNISAGIMEFPRTMTEMYMGLLDNDQEKFAKVFSVLSDPAYNTILFHCTAGKDRTGVTAMLLLSLAGVSDKDIAEDYSWSQDLIGPLRKHDDATPQYVLESNPKTMLETLDHLRQVYGSAREYLIKAGLSQEQLQQLMHKLVG